MPRNKTFEITGRSTIEFTMALEARDEDHALERMEWFLANRIRFLWKNTTFPKARKKQHIWIEDSRPDIDVDSCEPEEDC